MKAEKTRQLIETAISIIYGNSQRDSKQLHELCVFSDLELAEFERLTSKQEPMQVKVEQWIYTPCPSCGNSLSVHHGDGYYSIKEEVEWCSGCGQRLKWGESQEGEDES